MQAGFGRRIVGLPKRSFLPIHRRDIDYPSPATLDHPVHDLLGHVEARIQIGMHHCVPIRFGHFLKGRISGNTGIVHQHIHRTNFTCYRRHTRRARIKICNIAGIGLKREPMRLHRFQPRIRCGVARTKCRHHLITQRRQFDTYRFAQPAHAARNQCHSFARCHLCPLCVCCCRWKTALSSN